MVLLCALAAAACGRGSSLDVIVHGGVGPPTLVLLHGFGSSAEEWAPFTQTIQWPANGQFVFPQGPEVLGSRARPTGGRAWWPLGLGAAIPRGQSVADLSGTKPPGVKLAADLVVKLLALIGRYPGGPIVLGGFSQGAMVSSQVAFQSEARLAGLVLLSGTTVDEASWRAHYASRRGLPVFIAHGRNDSVLPFAAADRMRRDLQAAGLEVTWCPFDGGHEMPAEVVMALNTFLSRIAGGNRSQ